MLRWLKLSYLQANTGKGLDREVIRKVDLPKGGLDFLRSSKLLQTSKIGATASRREICESSHLYAKFSFVSLVLSYNRHQTDTKSGFAYPICFDNSNESKRPSSLNSIRSPDFKSVGSDLVWV